MSVLGGGLGPLAPPFIPADNQANPSPLLPGDPGKRRSKVFPGNTSGLPGPLTTKHCCPLDRKKKPK